MLMSSTLSKYVGRIIGFFRRKFPLHPDFEKLDPKNEQAVPAWWTNLRPKFEKDGNRKQKNKSSDCTYGGPNTRPLYYKCSDTPTIASDAEIADFVSSIDLRSILKKLMAKAIITHAKLGPMQQRAILAVLLQAAGGLLAPARRLAPLFDPNQAPMNKKSKADTSDTSTANKTITELLQSLSSKGRLKHLDEWRDINLNLDNIGQKQCVRNVLELCQCVCTREEMNTLKDGCNGDDGELLNTCKLVGKRAFMQMWAFEGAGDLDAEFIKNKAAGSKGKAMTYNAVGIRVKDYKKSLVASGCDYNNIRLCVKQG